MVTFPVCYIITDASPKAENFHKHAAYFGWDVKNIIEIESLPKPPPAARAKTTASTDEIFYVSLSEATSINHQNKSAEVSVHWRKKGYTIDSTATYYYIPFFYNDPCELKNNVPTVLTKAAVDSSFKVLVENKLTNGDDIVLGINLNVMTLVEKYVTKSKAKYEQELYMNGYRTKVREFSGLINALQRRGTLLSQIKDAKTKALFTEFYAIWKKQNEGKYIMRPDDFYAAHGITAKRHDADPLDLKELETALTVKYMGIFDIIETYCTQSDELANIINFIDKKS
jgi:hypothetical protein